ncbi:MAG: TonB family protein [Candidatus Omnitrophica bacterium]|nr:TonB family protein [Candidatus Omnitrophota bacterium]
MKKIKNAFIVLAVTGFVFLGGMSLSFAEDDVTDYVSTVSRRIANHIQYSQFPHSTIPAGKIRTVLEVSILSSGKIYLVRVVNSSGVPDFDWEAKNLVKALSPYPPLPASQGTKLTMRLPIEVVGCQTEDRRPSFAKATEGKQEIGDRRGDGEERIGAGEIEIEGKDESRRKKLIDDEIEKARCKSDIKMNDQSMIDSGEHKVDISAKVGKSKPSGQPEMMLSETSVGREFIGEEGKIRGVVTEAERLFKEALDKSDPAKVARQQLGLARLKINESRRNLFPKMEMQYSVSEGNTITDPYESQAYAIQLRHNLYDRGKTAKTFRKEKLNLEVAENEYKKTLQELKLEVVRSYVNILGKNEELEELSSFKENISRDFNLAKDIYEVKAISRIEFMEIEAENKRTLNMIGQTNNELILSKAKLRAAMNLPPEEKIAFIEKEIPLLGEIDIDVDRCIKLALENKPDVKLWEISLESAKYARDIASSESAPRFDVVTSYGASGEAFSEQDLNLGEEWKMMGVVTWLFGGNSFEVSSSDERISSKDVTEISRKVASTTYSAKLGIMDKLQYYVQKKEADIAYSQNLSNLSRNKQEVVFDTRKSFLEYQQSYDEYEVALFEAKFSSVNLDLKKEAFKIGKANLSEIVKARADYIRKRLALIRAKVSYLISLASLDNTTSYSLGLFPFVENTQICKKD